MERAEEENHHLREAAIGIFSNGKRVEDKFDKYANKKVKPSATCWRSKLNNMEGKFARLKENNTNYKRKLDYGSGGGSGGNYSDSGGGKCCKSNSGSGGDRSRYDGKRQ